VFYGWYIVWVAFIQAAFNSAVLIYGFTAFIDPIAVGLGWTYTQISFAVSLRGLEQGALNAFFGPVVDRFSARKLTFWGIFTTAVGLFFLSRVTNLVMFYVSFMIIAIGGSLALSMVPQVLIARWFRRDLGKASGIYAIGLGAGGLAIPLIVKLIDVYGWRNCMLFIAVGTLIIVMPLSVVFRNRPEECGLHPDGNPREELLLNMDYADPPIASHNVNLKQALKTKTFWFLGVATMFQYAAWGAIATHIMPFLSSVGIKRSTGGMVTTAFLLVSLFFRYPLGWLGDVLDKRYVNAACIALLSISTASLWTASLWFIRDGSTVPLIVLIVLTGFGAAGLTPLRIPIYREYFGVSHFGSIYGAANVFPTIGGIIGAPLAGWVFDSRGSYHGIWLILAILNLAGVPGMFMMPRIAAKCSPGVVNAT
jgi:MFS family permease